MRRKNLIINNNFRLLGFLVAFFAIGSIFAQPPSKDYQLLFEDNFDGRSIRENDWSYRMDRRQGGSFNALNRKENVFVAGGYLHVAVRQDTISAITQETKDGSTAGRLGDVGKQLQVIADVFIPTKMDPSPGNQHQSSITRFRGTLQDIRVFNRAVPVHEILTFTSNK